MFILHNRQRHSLYNLPSLCASLSVPAENARFAHLSGIFPLTNSFTQSKEEAEKMFVGLCGSISKQEHVSRDFYSMRYTKSIMFCVGKVVVKDKCNARIEGA